MCPNTSSRRERSLEVGISYQAAKFWSKVINEKAKKDGTGVEMNEEKPKKERKAKTVKELIKRAKRE